MLNFEGQKIAVVGLGMSNLALIDFLVGHGADKITACDRKAWEELDPQVQRLEARGIKLQLADEYLAGLESFDRIFLTPGLKRNLPELMAAKAKGIPFESEITLFFQLCPAPIVGITGSSGKTTTTTLVGKILGSTRKTFVGGNIGKPLIGELAKIEPQDLVVLELSSFQLQDLQKSPKYGGLLNITPNHLDIHSSMEEYQEAKYNLLRYQEPEMFAVIDWDCPLSRRAQELTGAQVFPFSLNEELSQGAFYQDGQLLWRYRGETEVICHRKELQLVGEHNVSNSLAAIALSRLVGAGVEEIRSVLTTFTGVEHRLELVRDRGGVKFYNDSIATTPARTMAALAALSAPIHLILGGYDKNLPFEELAQTIVQGSFVDTVYTIGDTAPKIEAALAAIPGKQPKVERHSSLAAAVIAAAKVAKIGEIVLLSPACASYDQFPNFQVRGERFKELVEGLE